MEKNKSVKNRSQIDNKYKWNLEAMYENEDLWEIDYKKALQLSEEYQNFCGKLGESSTMLLNAYKTKDEIYKLIEKVYVYAHMRKDEDNRVAKYQAMIDRCQGLMAKASASMSFFTPELMSIPENTILSYIDENPALKTYEFAIKSILREKEHVLSADKEKLLAELSEVMGSTKDIFTMLNNADMKFGEIIDEDGDTVTLTHGNYINFMESKNRKVRKAAFEKMYAAYESLINTIATTYNYNTKTDVIGARIRNYPSALDASLSGDNIPKAVYDNLIAEVNKFLPAMHKYMEIRKRLLSVDELHMYDIYVPLFNVPNKDVSYEKAKEMITDALEIMGQDYIEKMTEGLNSGWIDVYENEGKTSGAYSFGSYDSNPYILMNYSGTLKDVFTLIHEMGHSMHSRYTRSTQPYIYGGHSIFTAEVASTVNENLLMKQLLEKETDIEVKKYLLNLHLEEFRATVFRQTMFAEFEAMTHNAIEIGEVLTAEWLNDKYLELNKKYFGETVVSDREIQFEWARIPHFYNAFYVYMYATGYSAASAISDLIIEDTKAGSTKARDAYIEFLKSGDSNYPIELLKIAGIDMSSKEPVERALRVFEDMVEELAKLVQ